jgi:hypothetical protein
MTLSATRQSILDLVTQKNIGSIDSPYSLLVIYTSLGISSSSASSNVKFLVDSGYLEVVVKDGLDSAGKIRKNLNHYQVKGSTVVVTPPSISPALEDKILNILTIANSLNGIVCKTGAILRPTERVANIIITLEQLLQELDTQDANAAKKWKTAIISKLQTFSGHVNSENGRTYLRGWNWLTEERRKTVLATKEAIRKTLGG